MDQKSYIPTMWDREADVVIVGYGGAGAAAAITAHDLGAKVLILEKAPEGEEGGNSRVAGQAWFSPVPVDRAIIYFNELCGPYTVPQDIVRTWAEEMSKNTDWVKSLGGNPVEATPPGTGARNEFPESRVGTEFPEVTGSDCVRIYLLDGEVGHQRLWKLLKASVEKRRIDVLYAMPGNELIQNCVTGEILGVRVEKAGKVFNVKAKRAVVLTCGGFENNQEMVRDFLINLPYCYPLGTPYNTGDGIKMAMAVGADLWHMSNIAGPLYSLKVPEFASIFQISALHHSKEFPGGMILVAANGKRFVPEKYRVTHGKIRIGNQWTQSLPPCCPIFMIFDHTLFTAGPLYDKNLYGGWNAMLRVYDWSDDNSAELAKGWIKKGETIAELAMKVGLDPTVVEESINKWNSHCTIGKDLEFGRTKMLSPIQVPPFYAMEVSPQFVNTQGGPRRNAKGQIVRPNGNPIQRLYSAGELGSIHSFLYQGGGNVGECLAFGRISGRNAAMEIPWE